MQKLSNNTKYHLAYLLAGLVVGLALAFPAVRVATPTKVVAHRVATPYTLKNGAATQKVYNSLGAPARTVTQTQQGLTYQCGVFVGPHQSQQTLPDWYAYYCFRTS